MPVGKVLDNLRRHEELGVVRPAVDFLRQPHFFFAQRGAVGRVGVLLVGRAVADVAADDDQRRPIGRVLERLGSAAVRASRSLASATCTTCQP